MSSRPDPYLIDEDSPEWTAADFARARPIQEVDPEGIPFTDLAGLVRTSSADDRVIWRRCDRDRLLGEPVEEQPAGL